MAQIVETLPSGVTVYQVTDDTRLISNIYCERPYCSPDGSRFLYARRVAGEGREAEWEYVLCEFGSWRTQPVGRGGLTHSVSYNGDFHYVRRRGQAGKMMVRLDLRDGTEQIVHDFGDSLRSAGHPTTSPDGRYVAYGVVLSYEPQSFGVELLDLQTGERNVVCEDPEICNTHVQFEPAEGRWLLVQHNRGCKFDTDGTRICLVGDEGATVFLLDPHSGEIERLSVGKPHTTPLTGHQAWLGTSQEIVMTVAGEGDFAAEKGNVLLLRPGQPWRQVAAGREMNHIGSTPCGRYFFADGGGTQEIIVGSPTTGRTVLICHSQTSYSRLGFGQQGHPHAYLSPDFRHVVFNSDRTGRPQLYVAAVPDGLLDELDDDD